MSNKKILAILIFDFGKKSPCLTDFVTALPVSVGINKTPKKLRENNSVGLREMVAKFCQSQARVC